MSSLKHCGCGRAGCGCCAGIEPSTPRSTANRPGLGSIAYRIGTHGSFLQSMKARLSLHRLNDVDPAIWRPLAALSTREAGDPAVALLDAWALVGDVLSFYQERIANEGYLRTATEMRSLHEMARLVGYRPRPGVAASAYLAYTIDPNTKEEVVIPQGARSQSVPGPGELPQSFETGEPLPARAAWNLLKPRTTQPQRFDTAQDAHRLYLRGVTTNLKPGDPLLLVDRARRALVRTTEVTPEPDKERTRITFEDWTKGVAKSAMPAAPAQGLLQVLDHAPAGVTATRVKDLVRAGVEQPLRNATALPRALVESLHEAIDSEVRGLGALPAPNVRAWLAELDAALELAAEPALAAAAGPDGSIEGKDAVASLVADLARRPSRPLPSALQLERSLAAGFRKTGDAGLQLTGAVAPLLRDSIGAALSGIIDKANAPTLEVYAFRVKSGVFGRNAPKRQRIVRDKSDQLDASATVPIGEWPIIETKAPWELDGEISTVKESTRVVHLESSQDSILPDTWVVLDSSAVPVVAKGSAMVVPVGDAATDRLVVTKARSVHAKLARAEYGVTGDTTRLGLETAWIKFVGVALKDDEPAIGTAIDGRTQSMIDADFQVVRATTIYAQSERLGLAQEPIETELCDGSDRERPVELDGIYQDLVPGRFVVLSGERHGLGDKTVVHASEPLMITDVVHDVRAADRLMPWNDAPLGSKGERPPKLPGDSIHTFVWFDKPLSYCYRRDTVAILGNVVKATHGETRNETLGGGDGSKALQSFELKQAPLTYLAAPTAQGAASSLQVFVNDVRWQEEVAFVDRSPTDRIFVTKADEAGKATVVFGNGHEGARVPTGVQNIKAVYRNGLGKAGNVRAQQISQLSTRPLGVKEVINPLRASGGADPESRDQVRRNAPNAVMALDRLVATRDYVDFARSFAGIAKAAAVELSDGRRRVVHVTIAGTDDIPIDRDSDLFVNLGRALRDLGDPFQPLELAQRDLLILVISAKLRIDPDRRWEVVVTEVRTRLLEALGFAQRDLGQDVTPSEVLGLIQSVRGVAYVDLDVLGALPSMVDDLAADDGRRPTTPEETEEQLAKVLKGAGSTVPQPIRVELARQDKDTRQLRPAQLAVLLADVPATLVLNQIQ